MLNCHEVTRLVSESQERPLSFMERLSLKIHVMMCKACHNFSEQVPFIRQTMRAYAKGRDEGSR
ncbi:MAG: zf-HC2 domain-containing protein [Gammaproteobacteria bacterium]